MSDDDDGSSLSSASLQLGDRDRPLSVRQVVNAKAITAGPRRSDGSGSIDYGSDDSMDDLELGQPDDSVDIIELSTDDEADWKVPSSDDEGDNLKQQVRDSLLHPDENMAKHEMSRVACLRIMVVWAFVLGTAATGVLSWLFVEGILPLPDENLLPIVAAGPYVLVAVVVWFYDRATRRATTKLSQTANKNQAIVNSLFPANVRSRMLRRESRRIKQEKGNGRNRDASNADSPMVSDDEKHGNGNGSWIGSLASVGSRGSKGSKGSSRARRRRRRAQENRQKRKGRKADALAAATSPANQTLETAQTDTTAITTISTPEGRPSTPLPEDDDDEGLIPKEILRTKPIADFFPRCTVLFADIVGFTAWSSVRDPTDVFTLLESLYSCFDGIARRLKVFKVETIGDCYVAVTGLPEPQNDHAEIMAKFARSCMFKMLQIVRVLEKHLGPDTGDLSMRFGLHSGPVTAGVMRGEKSRFQLFGDTVNTAARIESTGERDKIHLSAETAELLIEAGKQHWVKLREQQVQAKGKGKLQTYWLEMKANSTMKKGPKAITGATMNDSESSMRLGSDDEVSLNGHKSVGGGVNSLVAMFEKAEKLNTLGERTRRQADYTVEVLTQILKKVAAHRWGTKAPTTQPTPNELSRFAQMEASMNGNSPLEDVNEAIDFASFLKASTGTKADKVQLPRNVVNQLQDFVTTIASMYKGHAFHCWEHASHVTISLTKLYSRLVDPREKPEGSISAANNQWGRKASKSKKDNGAANENASFGIPNDPLTEFALVFAAMVHDVSHPGFGNAKLVKDNDKLAQKYGRKSPAEQNSLDQAWSIFHRPAYQELRRYIYATEDEMVRFRQLVTTLVLATDMTDRDLFKERNKRWDRAFTKKTKDTETINRKATLVLEIMIQVSNIAHCVQHWNVYLKWNKKLFQEMCEAFKTGRQSGQKDPAEFWFQGELAFFDDVVIPLALKLKECGAFGDDAEEFVAYAKSNRRDFQIKGREVILDYLSEIRGTGGSGMMGTKHSASSSHSNASSLWSSDSSLKFKPPSSSGGKWTKPNGNASLSKFPALSPVPSSSSSRPPWKTSST